MKEWNEFYCHVCDGYVRVELDTDLNGVHIILCPKCGHEHMRLITNGKMGGQILCSYPRYRYSPTMASYSRVSAMDTSASNNYFLQNSWYQTTGAY